MIALSAAARAKIALGVGYYVQTLTITLTDGTVLNINNERILGDTGVEIEDATSGNDTFEVGSAIINQCRFTLVNFDATYDDIDFYGAKVQVGIGIPLGINQTEPISKGEFYVVDQTISDSSVTLTCYDAMQKFDRPYSLSTLAYPATLAQIVANACTVCGVPNAATTFPNSTLSIPVKPDSETLTFREVISWCAQIAGCFARIDRQGYLTFDWYDIENLGNEEAEEGTYHEVSGVFSHKSDQMDILVTGVRVIISVGSGQDDNFEYMLGRDGYVVEINGNDFITTDNVESIIQSLGSRLIGMRFRKMEMTHLSDPSFEAGDIYKVKTNNSGSLLSVNAALLLVNGDELLVSKRGFYYWGIVTYTKFMAGGNQTTRSDAEDTAINNASRYSRNTKFQVSTTRRLSKAEVEIQKNADNIDLCVKDADLTGNELVSRINLSTTTAAISAQRVSLAGKTMDFTADNIQITSTNFSVTPDGTLTCVKGEIGGFSIGATSLYNGMESLTDNVHDGVYVGTDGIALGQSNVWIRSNGSFKFGAIRSSGSSSENAWVTNALLVSYGCEIYAGNSNNEPYIDMHQDVDSPQDTTSYDYTARISNSATNVVSIYGRKTKNASTAEQCTVTAGAFSQGSDRRLKNGILPLDRDSATAFIEALKPSSFYFNGSGDKHHGFIHDEVDAEKNDREWVVAQMIPNLLGDGISYGTVNILEIVPDIVAVLQKILQDNEMLKQRVEALHTA